MQIKESKFGVRVLRFPSCKHLVRQFQFVLVLILCLGFGYNSADADTSEPVQVGDTVNLQGVELTDFRGRQWNMDEFASADCVVFAFLGVECPLAKIYTTRLLEIQQSVKDLQVAWVGVDANVQDSLRDMQSHARRFEWENPFLKDPDQSLAELLGATRTPEVCVVGKDGTLLYRGRIDDQHGVGYVKPKAQYEWLVDALESIAAGEEISIKTEPAEGCIIGRKRTVNESAKVTYCNQIVRLLNDRCVSCHREGDIGPMAFTDYEEVAGWSEMILEVVDDRRMPPWHADPNHGEFANDRRLTDKEMNLIRAWVKAGAPRGDESDLPEPPTFIEGWQMDRKPDMIVDVSPKPYMVPATGEVDYQYFTVDPKLAEDKWLVAAEFVPGNRRVVHHILAFARKKGVRRGVNGARGFLAGYVPGTRVDPMPAGTAKLLPAGSELLFQVHYTPVGTEVSDQSKFGLWFVDESEVTHQLQTTSAVQPRLEIPPRESDHRVAAMLPERLPECQLVSFSPHMHFRGKSFRYSLVDANNERQILLDVPEYDFNWQTEYRLKNNLNVKKGSRIFCEAVFDNSERNPHNPDPDSWVYWGDQTDDEMMIGYFHLVTPIERDKNGKIIPAESVHRRRDFRKMKPIEIFEALDLDGSGDLTKKEIPRALRKMIQSLDANNDGTLQRSEVPGG